MNILVISEQFKNGGLETQIHTLYNSMKKKHKIILAVRAFENNLDFSEATIYEGFNFSYNSLVDDFIQDVNKLKEIINKENIDCIHVHPFYSIYPAIFAAKIMNIPIAYTVHGFGSINFPSQMMDTLLLQFSLETYIDKIFSVSKICADSLNHASITKKTSVLTNCIDMKKFQRHKVSDNKIWAINSRLDSDKTPEIITIIENINKLDIIELHIYGTGTEEEKIRELIANRDLNKKVSLKGWSDNLDQELNEKYNRNYGDRKSCNGRCFNGVPSGFNRI